MVLRAFLSFVRAARWDIERLVVLVEQMAGSCSSSDGLVRCSVLVGEFLKNAPWVMCTVVSVGISCVCKGKM